jgi:hypothetical protein
MGAAAGRPQQANISQTGSLGGAIPGPVYERLRA